HPGGKGPHRCQVFHVRGVDLVERAISLTVIGPAIEHPVAGLRIGKAIGGHRTVLLDRARAGGDRDKARGREHGRQKPLLRGHKRYLPVGFFDLLFVLKRRCGFHPPCCPPSFPTNGAATLSEPSTIDSDSAASRRDAGPNTTCAPSRGSNSELWQKHLRTSLLSADPGIQPVTGHPACVQMAE